MRCRWIRHVDTRVLTALACLALTPALAQEGGFETTEDIPDVEIPDVEIPDVEVQDVQIGPPPDEGAFPAEGEEPAPQTAVFEAAPADDEEEAALTPVPLEDAREGTRTTVTGDIRAIDLGAGSVEVETDTQGTLRLSAERRLLRQLQPGQSVGLTFEDRDDGRWIEELEPLGP